MTHKLVLDAKKTLVSMVIEKIQEFLSWRNSTGNRTPSRQMYSVDVFGDSHPGQIRSVNQDCYFISNEMRVFVVADGLGGHKNGEIASSLAVKRFQHEMEGAHRKDGWFWPSNRELTNFDVETGLIRSILHYAIMSAQRFLHQAILDDPNLQGMGTTLTAAIISNRILYVAHVGDSRVYLLRRNRLTQLTDDHSYARWLVRTGQITLEEAKTHPGRNQLLQSLGGEAISIARRQEPLDISDRILLCTDGISNMIPKERLYEILTQQDATPQSITSQLIYEANSNGGRDNMTAIVISIKQNTVHE